MAKQLRKKLLHLYIDPEQRAELERVAKRTGASMASLVREATRLYLLMRKSEETPTEEELSAMFARTAAQNPPPEEPLMSRDRLLEMEEEDPEHYGK